MKRKALLFSSLALMLLTLALLLSGSPLLVEPLPGFPGFPFGNLLIWLALISFPLAIYTGIGKLYRPETAAQKKFRGMLFVIILLNAAWGWLGYSLSGNWGFNFTNASRASEFYWYYIYLIVSAPVLFLLAYGLYQLFIYLRKAKE